MHNESRAEQPVIPKAGEDWGQRSEERARQNMYDDAYSTPAQSTEERKPEGLIKDGSLVISDIWNDTKDAAEGIAHGVEYGVGMAAAVGTDVAEAPFKAGEAIGTGIKDAYDATSDYVKQNMQANNEDIAEHPGDAIFATAMGPAEATLPVAPEGRMLRGAIRGIASAIHEGIEGAEGFGEDAKEDMIDFGDNASNLYHSTASAIGGDYDSAVGAVGKVGQFLKDGFTSMFDDAEDFADDAENHMEDGYDDVQNDVQYAQNGISTAARHTWDDVTNPDWW